jgi:tRNA A37 N6-isopentenylltransferase MiaA
LLDGGIDREEAERRTDLRTRRLAKRQRTWFRHQVEALRLDAAAADLEARIIDAWNAAFPKRARG